MQYSASGNNKEGRRIKLSLGQTYLAQGLYWALMDFLHFCQAKVDTPLQKKILDKRIVSSPPLNLGDKTCPQTFK